MLKVLLHPEPQAFTFDIVAGESSDQDAVFRGALVIYKQLSSHLEIDVPPASMCVHSMRWCTFIALAKEGLAAPVTVHVRLHMSCSGC